MDVNWLATEARHLHAIFSNAFLTLVLTLITLGIVLEYFKMPLGAVPQFTSLVGRVFIACILWTALPEIMNMLSSVTDSFVTEIGSLIEFKYVLSRLADKFHELSFSWVSYKDCILTLISYLSFFLLYITVHLANAFFLFTWMMLYIFAPILIGMYVLPITSAATTKLFRSLIEVCLWKIVWCCMSALLWSMALSKINDPGTKISFLTAIILNLMLALSVLATPFITSAFLNSGVSTMASGFGNTLMNLSKLTPAGIKAAAAKHIYDRGKNLMKSSPSSTKKRAMKISKIQKKPIEPKFDWNRM